MPYDFNYSTDDWEWTPDHYDDYPLEKDIKNIWDGLEQQDRHELPWQKELLKTHPELHAYVKDGWIMYSWSSREQRAYMPSKLSMYGLLLEYGFNQDIYHDRTIVYLEDKCVSFLKEKKVYNPKDELRKK